MPIELPYVIDSDAPHLGGNLQHGDLGSFTPKTWAWVARRFAISSMLDIGCGEGHAVAYFHSIGVFSHGIDGLHANIKRSVIPIALHDLCNGPYIMPVDLAYCVEVAEHVSERHIDNLITTLCNGKVIVLTHALPGQEGYHHVTNPSGKYVTL